MSSPLMTDIEEIEQYTGRHQELLKAHHFLFDLVHPVGATPKFVVMGINPGESKGNDLHPGPTQETSKFDFHGVGRASLPWTRKTLKFLDGEPFVMTEIFFWSSVDEADFRVGGRYEGPLKQSPHLEFCVRKNKKLIAAYRPRAVIVAGLGQSSLCATAFELDHVRTVRRNDRKRTCEIYRQKNGVPWIVAKHWTGARGFTCEDAELIKNSIREEEGQG